MKRKRIFVLSLIAAAAISMNPVSASDTMSQSSSSAEAVLGEEPSVVVGEKSEKKGCYSVLFMNGTGKTITGIRIKDIYAGTYPDNMLENGDEIDPDERFELNFDSSSFADGDRFNILFEYGEKETGSITMFPFDDVKECELLITDELTHITYKDKSGTAKDTLEAEKKYRHISPKKSSSAADENDGNGEDEWYEGSYDYDYDYDYDSDNDYRGGNAEVTAGNGEESSEAADGGKEELSDEGSETDDTDADDGFSDLYDGYDEDAGDGSEGCIGGSDGCIGGSDGCIGGDTEEGEGDLW